ncbi:Isopenicillin N epimerase [Bdellovibrio bacteriovorus]|uniref:aminotransferase class V-fold PLP-dependent enzyme n=1 Tax=Bdellovibrio bacteriovorus TaxID=959 RepID=UPI00045BE8A5|nr:aminotransferase class V-fold PLP-dependent enzyme [Bdellovibrio bacteriovorus]AHZ84527.1 isopenicillin epimerase [Bdellovibrio bacteriovorus]BEV68416.1 Isopenicillin N epimerase [Bdellovibrio bacteriovorus]
MFQDFSAAFEKYKDTSFVNLNNGTLGLCPSVVIDQQKAELGTFEHNTSTGYGAAWARLWALQERLGRFIKARPQDLFLRPNVTLALNEIIMGLQLPADSEILSTSFEYGAVVNILHFKARKDRLSVRFINADFMYDEISADEAVSKIVSQISDKTRVFVVSHVFTGNGLTMPLEKLATALRARDVLLVVDGAHAPGLLDLNFTNELKNVDYYAGNLHKWFMGPKGTAFGWVNPLFQDQMQPAYGSWTTEEKILPGMGAYCDHPFAARMLWSHSMSYASLYGLESCFDFWDQAGSEFIRTEIQKRMNYLEDGLNQFKIKSLKGRHSDIASSLLCYKVGSFPGIEFDGLFVRHSKPQLQVGLPRVPGWPVLRLTPHIHNTQAELDSAISTLSKFV